MSRRRPSPALVIALLALAGSWGGPAVAQSLIGSKEVRNNSLTGYDVRDRSLQGRDLKSNTVTGRIVKGLSGRDIRRESLDGSNIDESTLDAVPRAASAATADSADALKGARVIRIAYAKPAGDTTTVLDEGGLAIRASCNASGALAVQAIGGGSAGGVIHVSATARGGNATTTATSADNDLRPGAMVDVIPAGAQNATGTLSFYGPAGDTITLDYLAQDGFAAGRGFQCLFSGTALHATP